MSRTLKRLFVWPWLLTLLLIGGHAWLAPAGDGRGDAFNWISLAMKALALGGLCMGAFSFERGDYLRKAFAFEAGTFGLLMVRDLSGLIVPVSQFLKDAQIYLPLRYTLVIVANTSSVVGAWMLAMTSEKAGLHGLGGQRKRWMFGLAGLSLGLALSGPAMIKAISDALAGKPIAFVVLASSTGDTLAIALSAPILLTALALRGGFLYYAWGLIAASRILWLIYDGMGILPDAIQKLPSVRSLEEAWRTLACLHEAAAGFAFWRILKGDEPPPDHNATIEAEDSRLD